MRCSRVREIPYSSNLVQGAAAEAKCRANYLYHGFFLKHLALCQLRLMHQLTNLYDPAGLVLAALLVAINCTVQNWLVHFLGILLQTHPAPDCNVYRMF